MAGLRPGHDAEGVACTSVQPPVFHIQLSNSSARRLAETCVITRILCRGPGQACVPSRFLTPRQSEGDGAPSDATICSLSARVPSRKHGAPLGAPPRQACAVRGYLRRLPYCAGPRFSGAVPSGLPCLRRVCHRFRRPLRQSRGQASTAAVSQAPGRQPFSGRRAEPGAARVRALRGTPAGAASCSITKTPLDDAPQASRMIGISSYRIKVKALIERRLVPALGNDARWQ